MDFCPSEAVHWLARDKDCCRNISKVNFMQYGTFKKKIDPFIVIFYASYKKQKQKEHFI